MNRNILLGVSLVTLATSLLSVPAPAMAQTPATSADAPSVTTTYDIAAQDLADALRQFGEQADVNVLYDPTLMRGRASPALHGAYTQDQALSRLLEGSGLTFGLKPGVGYVISFVQAPAAVPASAPASATERADDGAEILVVGSRILNVDRPRSQDDIQPYVVLSGEDFRSSGATNIEEYLQSRLTMNSQRSTVSQSALPAFGVIGPGGLNLRGLGSDQTLVLVDGRRLPSNGTGGDFGQPNLLGIPPSAIERIEILPSTASGIYGGGATGGVINVILKRDYSGLDVSLGYGNTFDSDASTRNLSLNWGGNFNEGRTHVTLSATLAEGTELLSSDRDFYARGAALTLANAPPSYLVFLISGGRNICSATVAGRNCDGGSLTLDDGTPLNSNRTYIPVGYAGPGSDGGQALVGNAGLLDLTSRRGTIWTAPSTKSYGLNARHEFTDWLEVYLDYARQEVRGAGGGFKSLFVGLPAASPYNPFQQDITVNTLLGAFDSNTPTATATTEGVTLGSIIRLPYDWSAALDYRHASLDPPLAFDQLGRENSPASLQVLQSAALRDVLAYPIDNLESLLEHPKGGASRASSVETYSLRLSGPLLTLPGGPLTAAATFEASQDALEKDLFVQTIQNRPYYILYAPSARDTVSQYVELTAPVISSSNKVPWINSLNLMAAVRHDSYKTDFQIGSAVENDPFDPNQPYELARSNLESTNYTVGLQYAPVSDITFRTSYGTGFLPPGLTELFEPAPSPFDAFPLAFLDPIEDPRRGGTQITGDADGNMVLRSGYGSADLKPELSTSFSYGFVLTPHWLEGLRLSVDFTKLEKTDEIGYLPYDFILRNEAQFPDRVIRAANLPGDLPGWAGPVVGIDDSLMNIGRSELRAIDLQADYTLATESMGDWHFFAGATKTETLSQEVISGLPELQFVGRIDGPLEWRWNLGADWNAGPWSAGWNAQYFGSYGVCSATDTDDSCDTLETWQGAKEIPSQIYHDVRVSYQLTPEDSMLSSAQLSFGIQNVFNESPPIVSSLIATNGSSSFGDPRLRRFTVDLRAHF